MAKKAVTYLIDILIVLAIFAVGAVGFKLISNKASSSDEEMKTVLVTVEFDKHEKELLEKIKVGEEILNSSKNELFGVIKSETPVEDSIITVGDYKKGKFIRTSTPQYGMKTIVVECKGKVSPTTVEAGGAEVRIGSEIGLRTNKYAIRGRIMGIDFED